MRGSVVMGSALLALAALASAGSRPTASAVVDVSELTKSAANFQAGHEYIFDYDGQVSSGLSEYNSNDNEPENAQTSMTRIYAQAKIHFVSAQRAHLQLANVQVADANGKHATDAKRVQPLAGFESRPLAAENREHIEAPVAFDYVDGLIHGVQFAASEPAWARNAKRAVLNLLQVNLRAADKNNKNNNGGRWPELSEESQEWSKPKSQEENRVIAKSYVVPETGIEGDCLTTYAINSAVPSSARWSESQEQESGLNVIKSVDFKRCRKIADVAFGFFGQNAQSDKCMRKSKTQKNENAANGSYNRFPVVDDESCDPKEVNEEFVQRSTVSRIELAVPAGSESPLKNAAIRRAETLSHYALRNAFDAEHKAEMHTIAVLRLLYRGCRAVSSAGDSAVSAPRHTESDAESLIYDNSEESDRKRFFMLGDKAENTNGEYKTDENKAKHAIAILRKLIEATVEKRAGVEGADATQIQQLINVLRICSVADLQTIQKEVVDKSQRTDEKRVQELLADAFAAAGTRNTVHQLMKKINEQKISPEQAAKSLRNLHNMPAPSDEIASELWDLVESEHAQRSPALHQASMLTFGAVVGKMCQGKISVKAYQQEQTMIPAKHQRQNNANKQHNKQQQLAVFGTQTGFNNQKKNHNKQHNSEEELACSPQKKQVYKQALMHQYQRASSVYDKVLALKTIGNAGLDTTVADLEAIILGEPSREQPMVRAAAVDALRRLRKQMPHKIQRITLAAYQNMRMPQHVRSVSLRMLMSAQPASYIIDQLLYTLAKERNSQLLKVAYTTARAYAASPLPEHQQIGQHLKNALKLTGVNEEQLNGASMSAQIPLFSQKHDHGVIVRLLSVFSDVNAMPIHFSAGVDGIAGGKQQHDMIRIAATQQGMSEVLEQAVEAVLSGAQDTWTTGKLMYDDRANVSAEQSPFEKLRNIFSHLSITSRKSQPHSYKNAKNVEAFAMLTMRVADIDQAILPLDSDGVKAAVAFAINQQNGELLWQGSSSHGFSSLSLTSIADKSAYIPTTAGVPVKIARAMPVLVCAEAQASKSGQAKVEFKGHLILTGMHTQKMGVESPLTGGAGVESARIGEMNVPLNMRAETERDQNGQSIARLIIAVPHQKTRLLGAHTIAHTYTRESHKESEMPARHKRFIRHPASQQSKGKEIDVVVGERSLGIPVRVVGHYNIPQSNSDLAAWLQLAMSSENHFHATLQPTEQTSRQIVLQAQGVLFQRTPAAQLGQALTLLKKIYEKYDEEFYAPFTPNDDTSTTYVEKQREKLAKIAAKYTKHQLADNDYENKGEMAVYKHTGKLSLKTNGGARDAFAHLIVEATTDARLHAWSIAIRLQCSPTYAQKLNFWRADVNTQMLWPEMVGSSAALSRLGHQKQQNFLATAQANWGSDAQQHINVRVEGKKAQWYNNNNNDNNNNNRFESNTDENEKIRFLNQFSIATDYKLESTAQNFCSRVFDLLKASQYWNVELPSQNGPCRDGQAFARVQIDPKSAKKARLEVRSPAQHVRIHNIWLPIRIRLMSLIRTDAPFSAHSVAQLFTRYMGRAVRAECSTNGKAVQTFDGARLQGPVASPCYSVLAKDCSNKDKPQFSVLMKSLSSDGLQKKIKVIVPGQEITCHAQVNGYDAFDGNKIACSINGKPVRGQNSRVPSWGKSSSSEEDQPRKRTQTSPIVEFDDEECTAVTITSPSGAVTVRFLVHGEEGKQQTIRIYISGAHKNTQCGLCGHFDNNANNEWLSADNKDYSKNPTAYHRSYTMSGFDDEENNEKMCTEESKNKFYNENKDKFAFHKREVKNINTKGIWSDESEDEGFLEGNRKYNWNEDEDNQSNQLSNRSENPSDNTFEPELKTKVIDHHHQMCFSKNPVYQCPEGSSPFDPNVNNEKSANVKMSGSDEEDQFWSAPWNSDKSVTAKTSYVCVPRHEAGQLIRSATAGNTRRITELLRSQQPSFTIAEPVPAACRRH